MNELPPHTHTPNHALLTAARRAVQERLDAAILRGQVPEERMRVFHNSIWMGCTETLERAARWLDVLEARAAADPATDGAEAGMSG